MTDPLRLLPSLRRALAGAAVFTLAVVLFVSRVEWRAPDGDDGTASAASADGLAEARGDIAQGEPPAAVFSQQTVLGNVAEAEVREGEVTVVDFVVPRRAVVRGLVVVDGRPVSGAVVHHRRHVAWALCHLSFFQMTAPSPETVTTGADGRFEQSLPYGGEHVFWAVAPDGYWSREVKVNLSSGTACELELPVPRSAP